MIYQTPLSNVVEDANAWELQIESHPSVSSKFKRLLDIIGSVVGLTILAILFVPIAIAIKLDSPGAIFYTQERYGLHGRPFMLLK
ncbi:MAG: sugar transferase, partial [Nostocaceae cyanobacterium]|nr:sugar transferase [Nostocaceae cyanobacterium]